MSEKLLTMKEAGIELGVSYSTIRRRIAEGHLPIVRLGKQLPKIKLEVILFIKEHGFEINPIVETKTSAKRYQFTKNKEPVWR